MRATNCSIGAVVAFVVCLQLCGTAKAQERESATQPAPTSQPDAHAWDLTQPDVRVLPLAAWDVAFSADGVNLAVAGDSIFELEIATGRERWRTDVGRYAFGRRIALSPDGKRLAVSHSAGVFILDADTGAIVLSLVRDNPNFKQNPRVDRYKAMTPVAFSPDGKSVASSVILDVRGEIDLWDAHTGKLLRTLSGSKDKGLHYVFDVAFSPDSLSLATVDGSFSKDAPAKEGGRLRIWDLANGTIVQTYDPATFSSWTVAFSPDGKFLASGGGLYGRHDPPRGELRVWDVATGRAVYTGYRQECVFRLRFSPDGTQLVSGGGNRASRIAELAMTDTSTWLDAPPVTGPWGRIEGIAFSHDGRLLATASPAPSLTDSLRIWNFPGRLAKTAHPCTPDAPPKPAIHDPGK